MTVEAAPGIFTAIVAATAEGLGQAAVFDRQQGTLTLVVDGVAWTHLGFLAATLMNDLFVLEGHRPIPSLAEAGTIDVVASPDQYQ